MVLPWVPVTDTVRFIRISSASISARRITGMPRWRAAHQFRVGLLDRRRNHHVGGVSTLPPSWPMKVLTPRFADAGDVGALLGVAALHVVAEVDQDFGDRTHADAADADDVERADVLRHLHGTRTVLLLERRGNRDQLIDQIGETSDRVGLALPLGCRRGGGQALGRGRQGRRFPASADRRSGPSARCTRRHQRRRAALHC